MSTTSADTDLHLRVEPDRFDAIAAGRVTIEGRPANEFFYDFWGPPRLTTTAPRSLVLVRNDGALGTEAERAVRVRVVAYRYFFTLRAFLAECADDAGEEDGRLEGRYRAAWSREQIAAAGGVAAVQFVRADGAKI